MATVLDQNQLNKLGRAMRGDDTGVSLERITPERAAELLATVINNRRVDKRHMNDLANAIRRGEWQVNGDTIRISPDGELLDGQHRLAAIVQCGIPVDTLVVRDISRDSFLTIDSGRKARGFADVLKIDGGYKNAVGLAGGTRAHYNWMEWVERPGRRLHPGFTTGRTTQQLLGHFNRHRDGLIAATHAATTVPLSKFNSVQPISDWVALTYEFARYDEEAADYFIAAFCAGEDGAPGLLRDRLTQAKLHRHKQLGRVERMALTIKAFNHYVHGTEVVRLTHRVFGKSPSMFPIVGDVYG